jgi:hypothetical protein
LFREVKKRDGLKEPDSRNPLECMDIEHVPGPGIFHRLFQYARTAEDHHENCADKITLQIVSLDQKSSEKRIGKKIANGPCCPMRSDTFFIRMYYLILVYRNNRPVIALPGVLPILMPP